MKKKINETWMKITEHELIMALTAIWFDFLTSSEIVLADKQEHTHTLFDLSMSRASGQLPCLVLKIACSVMYVFKTDTESDWM